MGIINIYNDENDQTYQVTVDLQHRFLAPESAGASLGQDDYYLEIYTNIPKADSSQQLHHLVRTLNDVDPDSAPPAADFQELVVGYVEYFMTQGELGMSSSSSSSSQSLSSQSLSSNSSSSQSDSSSSQSPSSASSLSSGPH